MDSEAYVKHQAGTTLSLFLTLHGLLGMPRHYEYHYKIQVWHDSL